MCSAVCGCAHLHCAGEYVLEMPGLRHRCELIRVFAGGRDEHPKNSRIRMEMLTEWAEEQWAED